MKARAVSLACALLAAPALAQTGPCAEYDKLRAYGEKHFAQIKGPPLLQGMNERIATFKLPGADECVVDPAEPKLSRYSCKWFIAQGESEGRVEAAKAYEGVVKGLVGCSSDPASLHRWKTRTEKSAVLFPFAGQKANQMRVFEVTYRYAKHWWHVELEYEVNDAYSR